MCAYCDADRRDRDARLVVHSHHVCLVVGDDPAPRLRRERLLRAAREQTENARRYAEDEQERLLYFAARVN